MIFAVLGVQARASLVDGAGEENVIPQADTRAARGFGGEVFGCALKIFKVYPPSKPALTVKRR